MSCELVKTRSRSIEGCYGCYTAWTLTEKCEKPGVCFKCRADDAPKRCAGCYVAWYCGPQCQKDDWKDSHKPRCLELQAEYTQVNLLPGLGVSDACSMRNK